MVKKSEPDLKLNDAFDEKLSAAIDNEASEAELQAIFEEIDSDPLKREAWERHHLIDSLLVNRHTEIPIGKAVNWEKVLPDVVEGEVTPPDSKLKNLWDSIRNGFSVTWVGGAALATCVLLAVSLVITMQPQFSSTPAGLTADEIVEPAITPMSQMARTAVQPQQMEVLDQPEINKDEQLAETMLVRNRSGQGSARPAVQTTPRSMPPRPQAPRRELVRLVSD